MRSLFYKVYRNLGWIITVEDSATDIFSVQFAKIMTNKTPPVDST